MGKSSYLCSVIKKEQPIQPYRNTVKRKKWNDIRQARLSAPDDHRRDARTQ